MRTNSTNLHVIPVFILFFVVHLWYFIIEIDVKQKVILFVLVFLFSGLNQWVHDETANSPSVAYRTYFVANLLLCLYFFGLMELLVAKYFSFNLH